MTYDEFTAEWNGNQVTKYGGECVALVAEYEAENNLPIVWGDAHSWINNPIMSDPYIWIDNNPNDPNQYPNHGDIIVWPLPNEHIAFFDHNLGDHQFMSFGQNSGGPEAHFQPHNWANVAGWYVAKQAPASLVPTALPDVVPYTVIENYDGGKQVRPNKDPITKWGMNYDNLSAMEANPVAIIESRPILTIVNKVQHNTGGQYYRLADDTDGFNVVDCDDYTYVPPAAPIPVPLAKTYILTYPVSAYATATNAGNHVESTGIVQPGSYYIYNTYPGQADLINVTTDNTKPGNWINTDDDVPPVVPPVPEQTTEEKLAEIRAANEVAATPTVPPPIQLPVPVVKPNAWKTTYKPFIGLFGEERKSINYVFIEDYNVTELDKGKVIVRLKGAELEMAGKFDGPDGKQYLRPTLSAQAGTWYGVDPHVVKPLHPYDLLETDEGFLITEIKQMIARDGLTFSHLLYQNKVKLNSALHDVMDIFVRKRK